MCNFVNDCAQNYVNAAIQMGAALSQKRLPTTAGDFGKEVQEKLELFCVVEVAGSAVGGGARLVGRSALAYMWQAIQKRADDNENIDGAELRAFHMFYWMLSTEHQDASNKLVAANAQRAGGVDKGAARPKAPQRKQGLATQEAEAKTKALVLRHAESLFKNKK